MAQKTAGTHKSANKRAAHEVTVRREKYGGFNIGAAFFGWLVATAIAVLLTALLTAAGVAFTLTTSDKTINNVTEEVTKIGVGGGIVFLIVLAVAYYAGGYVAGRMSRFDGGRQGFGVWVIGIIVTILLAIVTALFGTKYNILEQLTLPRIPIDEGSLTAGGIITLVVSLVVTLVAAIGGGKVGRRYHAKVDHPI